MQLVFLWATLVALYLLFDKIADDSSQACRPVPVWARIAVMEIEMVLGARMVIAR